MVWKYLVLITSLLYPVYAESQTCPVTGLGQCGDFISAASITLASQIQAHAGVRAYGLPPSYDVIVPLAARAATSPPQAWSPVAKASQLEALDYIERLEWARSAGPDAAADALGMDSGALAEVGTASGAVRNFGGIELATELDQRSGQTTIIVRASGGCIDRDVAKAKLVLGKIVWAPLADSPAPVFGYARFQGGSASTVFFDATGSRCLTGVRIEDPTRLKGAIEAAYKQEASK